MGSFTGPEEGYDHSDMYTLGTMLGTEGWHMHTYFCLYKKHETSAIFAVQIQNACPKHYWHLLVMLIRVY